MKPKFVLCTAMVAFLAACLFEAQAATYKLGVAATHHTQPWNRFYEKAVATDHQHTLINTYWNRGIGNALKIGHDSAGFQYWRGHGVLDADDSLVDTNANGTLKLNWKLFDAIYDTGTAVGMTPVVEIGFTPPALASGTTVNTNAWYDGVTPNKTPPNKTSLAEDTIGGLFMRNGWGRWVALMDSIVKHVEQRYGKTEVEKNWYFEIWNEPDSWYTNFYPAYLTLFSYSSYGLHLADSLVRVGGPTCEGTNIFQGGADFRYLLNYCHTSYDSATYQTGTRIDFLTYHWYSDNTVTGITGGIIDANNSRQSWEMVTDSMRNANYSWFTGPILEDEMGPTYDADAQRDNQTSASWVVKAIHLINEAGPNFPPPVSFAYWAISDLYEETEDNLTTLSFEQGNFGMMLRGNYQYPNSFDIPKPVFQAYKMLHRLSAFEDSSWGGDTTNGVNLIATSDSGNDSMQIIVYDHQYPTTGSVTTDSIILTIDSIPWAPGPVHVEDFLVDTTHSNTYSKWVSLGKPAVPTNAQWDSLRKVSNLAHYDSVATDTLTGNTFTKSFSEHYYSVMLIVLSNPHRATSVKRSSDAVKNAAPPALRAGIHNGVMMLTLPQNDRYTVRLISTSGRTVFASRTSGSGTVGISLPKIPSGIYMVQCAGMRGSYVAQVVAAP